MSKNFDSGKWLAKMREQKLRQIDGYLSKGWAVFPVSSDKRPLISNGCRGATTDREQIRQWWQENPYANVAIATGRKSNLLVIDIDNKKDRDGLSSLNTTYAEHLDIDLAGQLIAVTPTHGFHLYYEWNERIPVTTAVDVLPGIDIRGEGGYVLAPPSRFKVDDQWRKYEWHDESQPIPPSSAWVIDLCEQTLNRSSAMSSTSRPSSRPLLDLHQVLTGISQGHRDDQLFRYACHLRGLGIDYVLALGFIRAAAARCEPPFSDAIAIDKVNRAYQGLELNFPLSNED